MTDVVQDVISPLELDDILSNLRTSPLEWIGSAEWSRQMSMIEELNVQAALEADRGGEEKVRDSLVEHDKMPLIVHELLAIEMWRQNVLPLILAKDKPQSSFQIYMVLFNEANLCNLLETTLFSSEACAGLKESAIDLVDYCIRQLSYILAPEEGDDKESSHSLQMMDLTNRLANWKPGMELPEFPVEDVLDELSRHKREVGFQIAMKSISILRYLSDHLDQLPLSVTTRMVVNHDIPVLFTQLITTRPWYKMQPKGGTVVYQGSEWSECSNYDEDEMPKLEGQTWIAMYNLMSKPECIDKYELHSYRIGVLAKLTDHIHENKENQLPVLTKFRQWLLQLSLAKPSAANAPTKELVMIEAVAEIHQSLLSRYEMKWNTLAEQQADLFMGETSEELAAQTERILKALESDAALSLIGSGQKKKAKKDTSCVVCRVPGAKSRCARCHVVRYCGRECQSKHWPKHRKNCKKAN